MAIIQSGASAATLSIDSSHSAARISVRPIESVGSFRLSMSSGTIAASTGAGSILFGFRNAGSNVIGVRRLQIGFNTTTGYTQGGLVVGAYATRTYTVIENTAATAATLTTNNNKARTSLATATALASICTTTTMSGGTGTDDSQPVAQVTFNMPTIITSLPVVDFFNYEPSTYPLLFAANEGLRIRNVTAFPATGASTLIVNIEWFEATAF